MPPSTATEILSSRATGEGVVPARAARSTCATCSTSGYPCSVTATRTFSHTIRPASCDSNTQAAARDVCPHLPVPSKPLTWSCPGTGASVRRAAGGSPGAGAEITEAAESTAARRHTRCAASHATAWSSIVSLEGEPATTEAHAFSPHEVARHALDVTPEGLARVRNSPAPMVELTLGHHATYCNYYQACIALPASADGFPPVPPSNSVRAAAAEIAARLGGVDALLPGRLDGIDGRLVRRPQRPLLPSEVEGILLLHPCKNHTPSESSSICLNIFSVASLAANIPGIIVYLAGRPNFMSITDITSKVIPARI